MKHRASAGCRIFDIFPGSVTGKATSGGTRGRIPESRKWKTCDTGADGFRSAENGKRAAQERQKTEKTTRRGAAGNGKSEKQATGRRGENARVPRTGCPKDGEQRAKEKRAWAQRRGKNTEKTARRSGRREEGKGTGNREETVRKAQGQSGKGGKKGRMPRAETAGKGRTGKGLL